MGNERLPLAAAPEQHGLGQRRQHRFQRWRDRSVAGEHSGQHSLHPSAAEPVEDILGLCTEPVSQQRLPRLEELFEGQGIRLTPSFDLNQLDEGGEEDAPVATSQVPGPVQEEGGRTLVLGQAGTVRVRRLFQ